MSRQWSMMPAGRVSSGIPTSAACLKDTISRGSGMRQVAGVVDLGEPVSEPFPASLVQVGQGVQQQSTNPVERVALAAAMAEGLFVHAATDVVDAFGDEADAIQITSAVALECPPLPLPPSEALPPAEVAIRRTASLRLARWTKSAERRQEPTPALHRSQSSTIVNTRSMSMTKLGRVPPGDRSAPSSRWNR